MPESMRERSEILEHTHLMGNKIITTGGGGAVTAKDAKTVAHMQYISTQARMIRIIIFIMKSDIIIA